MRGAVSSLRCNPLYTWSKTRGLCLFGIQLFENNIGFLNTIVYNNT